MKKKNKAPDKEDYGRALSFKIISEKKKKYVELDVDMSEEINETLLDFAKKNIMNDEKALLSWAVTNIIETKLKD